MHTNFSKSCHDLFAFKSLFGTVCFYLFIYLNLFLAPGVFIYLANLHLLYCGSEYLYSVTTHGFTSNFGFYTYFAPGCLRPERPFCSLRQTIHFFESWSHVQFAQYPKGVITHSL